MPCSIISILSAFSTFLLNFLVFAWAFMPGLQERQELAVYCDAYVVGVQRRSHDARDCGCIFVVRYEYDGIEVKLYLWATAGYAWFIPFPINLVLSENQNWNVVQ